MDTVKTEKEEVRAKDEMKKIYNDKMETKEGILCCSNHNYILNTKNCDMNL